MRYFSQRRLQQQMSFLQRQFLQDGNLAFGDVLSEEIVVQALTAINVVWLDRIYSPLVTLWVFLGQVLSADHSCRAAVARLIAHRLSQGQQPCSAETGAYCQARKHCLKSSSLPWLVWWDAPWTPRSSAAGYGKAGVSTCLTARQLRCQTHRKTNKRIRKSTIKDRASASRSRGSAPSLLCLVGPSKSRDSADAGKGQGEVSLLRRLWGVLHPGDVLLTDCLMANWTNIWLLQQRGVELVSRVNKANRKADFRRGRRLGDDDHIVRWFKPSGIRSLDWKTYKTLPECITIREARIRVAQPGFRTKSIVVVTTLLDPQQTTKEDLATLYRARWNNELDLRSIKSTMQMRDLRCKTPDLVQKEIWTAYTRLQPHPHDHGSGRGEIRPSNTIHKLQGLTSNLGSISAADRASGRP